MKVWTGLRNTIVKRKWIKIERTEDQARLMRVKPGYQMWFVNAELRGRYAVFSVGSSFEYWFESPETATEFLLRFS